MSPDAALRVVFMGTPDFAVPSLRALVDDERCNVVLVVSQPDRRSGRGQSTRPTPVAAAAGELGIELFQPPTLRDNEATERLGETKADLFVVAAYGQILRREVLDLPAMGCINVHASLLPRWRGAAPIHRAIAAGDAVTGVSIMQMELGLDTGPVYAMHACMIGDTETAGELHDRLAESGAQLLVDTLPAIIDPAHEPTPQPQGRSTYARMLDSSLREVDFSSSADRIAWHINGMSPWPGARVRVNGTSLSLLRARAADDAPTGRPGEVLVADRTLVIATAQGAVEILEAQRSGKRRMTTRELLQGYEIEVGSVVNAP